MSFDPQDCEEMPILASEHIGKLEAENKALKLSAEIFKTESEIKDIMKVENKTLKKENKALKEKRFSILENAGKLMIRIKKIETSRDELLSALEVAAQEDEGYVFNDTIQRAKTLKNLDKNVEWDVVGIGDTYGQKK